MLPPMADALPEDLPPFFDEDLPIDKRKCRLLGPTALVVQALMGVFVILSLVYKRHRESPKRPWRIWAFDVSKQVVGQMFVHGMNLLISGVGAHHASSNPCALYFLNILIDTTLGIGLIYLIHRSLTHVFSSMLQLKGFRSGQYGNPPSLLYWVRQAAVYVTSLTTMKVIVISLFAVWPGIFKIGDWLLGWTGGGDGIQVIFVMGLFPIAMNVLQFWLIDSIVKAASQDSELLPSTSPRHSADREPLINATGSDDEDEGCGARHESGADDAPHADSSSHSISSKTTLGKEQKHLSSRASIDEPEEGDETHSYPPSNSSASSSTRVRGNPLARLATPRRLGRKQSPTLALELKPSRKTVDSPTTHLNAVTETPSNGRKTNRSADVAHVTFLIRDKKLLTRYEQRDWATS